MANWFGKQCSCGRIMKKMHCAACGSTNIYGLTKQARHAVTDETGLVFEQIFKTYRCRACAEVFDEWITLNYCKAPPLETIERRVAGPAIRENRRDKINEILRLSGIDPNQKTGATAPPTVWKDEFFGDDGKSPKGDEK